MAKVLNQFAFTAAMISAATINPDGLRATLAERFCIVNKACQTGGESVVLNISTPSGSIDDLDQLATHHGIPAETAKAIVEANMIEVADRAYE